MSQLAAATRRQMSQAERVIFASGDIFGGGGAALISVLYLFYLTDIIGLNPGLAGLALLIPKIWDAVNNPLMGIISDNFRSKWGRRRPFIAAGGFLLIASLALIWAPIGAWPSQIAKMGFAMGANLFYATVATMVAVPYGSLSTEVSTDYDERNQINVMRLAFSTVASAGCTLAGTMLLGAYTKGQLTSLALYATLVIGFGLLFTIPVVLVGLRTQERAPIPAGRAGMSMQTLLEPLSSNPFRMLLWLYLCQALTMDVISALIVYYSLYVVKVNVTVFLGIFIAVNLVGFVVVGRLVKTVSKNLIYRALIPLALVGALIMGAWPSSWPPAGMYLVGGLIAVGVAGGVLMSWVMFPDVIDDEELRTGQRNAGTYSGLMTLIRGLATAIAVQLIGLMLQVTGYQKPEQYANPVQPAATLTGIRVTITATVIVLMGLGWFVAGRYLLTRKVCETNQAKLEKLRASTEHFKLGGQPQ